MDEYSLQCIKYLRENNPKLLEKYLTNIERTEDTRETKNGNISTIFSCKKCGKKDVTYIEKQIRSADEGSSIYYKCNSCRYMWHDK